MTVSRNSSPCHSGGIYAEKGKSGEGEKGERRAGVWVCAGSFRRNLTCGETDAEEATGSIRAKNPCAVLSVVGSGRSRNDPALFSSLACCGMLDTRASVCTNVADSERFKFIGFLS